MKSFDLIDNVPIYARSLDEHGLLEHLSNAVQPQLDAIIRNLDIRDIFFDPRTCPPRFLPYLAQFWGLASEGDHWQGIGLNPDWADGHTRAVIQRIPFYWVQKGTAWGIREAIALWLQWEPAHSSRLDIRLPFGDAPMAHLPQWWDFNTRYDAFLNETWRERQQYGSGDYPQRHRPWFELVKGVVQVQDGYELWSDRLLTEVEPPTIDVVGSALGPERPWMHFDLYEAEWSTVVPDIVKLNPEIWSSFAEPEVFAWLGYRLRAPLKLSPSVQDGGHFRLDEHLVYDGFQYGDWWYFEAGTPLETTQTVTQTELFGLAPGHGYTDVWNSPQTPTAYDYLYYVPAASRTVTLTETLVEYRSCRQGFLATLQTGTKQQYTGRKDAIAPSQTLDRYNPFNYTIDMGGLSLTPDRPNPYVQSVSIDLTGVAPLALTDLELLTYTYSFPAYAIEKQLQYVPRIVFPELPIFSSQPVYQLTKPWRIMLYHDLWDSGYLYYYPGEAADAGTLETVPVYSNHRLCNLADHYSMKLIERTVIRVPLPIAEINIFDAYPILKTVSEGKNWQLLVETTEQIYILRPVTMFWSERFGAGTPAQRSQTIDLESKPKFLYLEFLFQPLQDGFLLGSSLLLEQTCLQSHAPGNPLALTPYVTVGVRVVIPFQLESGAQTFEEDQAIVEYLPQLWQDMVDIKYTANHIPMPDPIELPVSDSPTDNTLRTLLEQVHQQMLAIQADLTKFVTVKKEIFPIILGDGVTHIENGIYTVQYQVSTGLGDQNFGVGEFQYASGNKADVETPVIERTGEDSINVTLLSSEAIPDGTFALWIYQSTRPEPAPVTIDVVPVSP